MFYVSLQCNHCSRLEKGVWTISNGFLSQCVCAIVLCNRVHTEINCTQLKDFLSRLSLFESWMCEYIYICCKFVSKRNIDCCIICICSMRYFVVCIFLVLSLCLYLYLNVRERLDEIFSQAIVFLLVRAKRQINIHTHITITI